jgi:hypothetical protein
VRLPSALWDVYFRSNCVCPQGACLDLMQIDIVRISFTGLAAWNSFGLMDSRVSLHFQLERRFPIILLTAQVSSQHQMQCHHHTFAL